MAIKTIEIAGHGFFLIKDDLLHRPKSYLKTYTDGRFKEVQFDSYIKDYTECYPHRFPFQKGYDYNGKEIQIRVVEETKR